MTVLLHKIAYCAYFPRKNKNKNGQIVDHTTRIMDKKPQVVVFPTP